MNYSTINKLFPDNDSAMLLLKKVLWPNGVVCPYCKASNISVQSADNRYHCNSCNSSFSPTVRTIFHKTKIPLSKWFYLIYLIKTDANYSSLRLLAAEIGVTKDTVQKMIRSIKAGETEMADFINFIVNYINNKK